MTIKKIAARALRDLAKHLARKALKAIAGK